MGRSDTHRPRSRPVRGLQRLSRGAYTFRGRLFAVVMWSTVTMSLIAVLGPPSSLNGRIVALELAGNGERGQAELNRVPPEQVVGAIAWDVGFIFAYGLIFFSGLALFPRRAYRVYGWRAFRRIANLIVVVVIVLD